MSYDTRYLLEQASRQREVEDEQSLKRFALDAKTINFLRCSF